MVKGQNEAEQKKRKSTEMKAKLEIQQKKCAEKKAEVEEDFGDDDSVKDPYYIPEYQRNIQNEEQDSIDELE